MSSITALSLRKPDHKMEKPVKSEATSLEARISASAIETLKLLAARMQKKSKDCLTKPTAINTGAFYPNTYYELLQNMLLRPYSDKVKSVIQKRMETMTANGSFYHGTAPKEFFKPIPLKDSPSGFMSCAYALKDSSVRPSEALMAILEDKCLIFISCGEAVQIAYYKALLDLLGPEKFDYIFAADGPIPFTLGLNHPSNPLLKLTSKLKGDDALSEGCWIYKGNTSFYKHKHMNGDCVGFNLLYSDKRYFGLGLKPTGETQEELDQTFMAEYNRQPMGMKGLSEKLGQKIDSSYEAAQLATFKKMHAHQISFEEYRKTSGGKIYAANMLNPELVKGLMMFDKESGRKLFERVDRTS